MMMHDMMGGGMWGMGLVGILVVLVLVLAAAALIKYLFSNERRTIMNPFFSLAVTIVGMSLSVSARAQSGDPGRGERLFRACAPCHSLENNRSMTGPSLADLWNRKAGSIASFRRYSPALKDSGIVWDEKTLDAWIADPQHFIPGNTMTFPGLKDARQRTDLLAFLKEATEPGRAPSTMGQRGGGHMGGMMGMMGGGAVPNLKKLDPDDRVQAIAHCHDTYRVTTADGKTRDFWERNLRFKDRRERRRSAERRTGAGAGRHDGRPGRRDLCGARGNQRVYRGPMLKCLAAARWSPARRCRPHARSIPKIAYRLLTAAVL
jgi:cytochrome c